MIDSSFPWDQASATAMSRALLDWFERYKRPLPWREEYTPYGVWISEVMLQQTQMERGVAYWLRWMQRFPSVAAVAAASEEELLRAWEGLGYYRRARFLHQAAQAMMQRHQGCIPENPEQLAALPGLGAYTVAAIRGIAFQHDVVAVDANLERVFARLLNLDQSPKKKEAAQRIRAAAEYLLPRGQARNYNQALMELGALLCRKSPLCPHCPLEAWCLSRSLGLEAERPVKDAAAPRQEVQAAHGLLLLEGRALIRKRPDSGLWGGLWEFPGGELLQGETPQDAVQRVFEQDLGLKVRIERDLGELKHSYTRYRLSAHFFLLRLAGKEEPTLSPNLRLANCAGEGNVAMPAHHRKMADRFFKG